MAGRGAILDGIFVGSFLFYRGFFFGDDGWFIKMKSIFLVLRRLVIYFVIFRSNLLALNGLGT